MGMTSVDILIRNRDGDWFHGTPQNGLNRAGLPEPNEHGEVVLENASLTRSDLVKAAKNPRAGGVSCFVDTQTGESWESVLPVMARKDITWEALEGPIGIRDLDMVKKVVS